MGDSCRDERVINYKMDDRLHERGWRGQQFLSRAVIHRPLDRSGKLLVLLLPLPPREQDSGGERRKKRFGNMAKFDQAVRRGAKRDSQRKGRHMLTS